MNVKKEHPEEEGNMATMELGKTGLKIEKNVTFKVYDNSSGAYFYYGPSLIVNGTLTAYSEDGTVIQTTAVSVPKTAPSKPATVADWF